MVKLQANVGQIKSADIGLFIIAVSISGKVQGQNNCPDQQQAKS